MIGDMAVATSNAFLQMQRVTPGFQQVRIVVRFQHGNVAGSERANQVFAHAAHIRKNSHAGAGVFYNKAMWVMRIVEFGDGCNRKRPNGNGHVRLKVNPSAFRPTQQCMASRVVGNVHGHGMALY